MDENERIDRIQDAKEVSLIHLRRKAPTHTDVLSVAKDNLSNFIPDYTEEELSSLVTEIEFNIRITTQEPDILVDPDSLSNWFRSVEPTTETRYFDRYVRHLRQEGFPEPVLTQMSVDARRVLALSANPNSHKDFKRGLVVGDVQSGKTANYLSLINLACDFGYKIVVLLAGMTDSLREQTQDRVDLGFIGALSDSIGGGIQYVGVGLPKEEHYAVPMTNTKQDFVKWLRKNINATPSEYSKPLVLVVKKNKGVLEQVTSWLKSKQINNLNVLVVDDEADNASINSNREENNPTQINKKIRELISSFNVATYVGFTATPFANIFINPSGDANLQSLFPSDFIVQLKTPSNYRGAHWFFDKANRSTRLRLLDENEPNFLPAVHKRDAKFTALPNSMKEAILVFLLGCAVRTKRGQKKKHRSMLVNISRFNDLQKDIKYQINDYVFKLSAIIEQESYKPLEEYLKNPILNCLHDLYMSKDLFAKARSEIDFDSLREPIREEINLFEVVVMNNKVKSEDRFNYKKKPNGARVIAVGGFLLSRGLTLEGLMVSYYSRNTATYDSLLQMGRWFGYRFGYDDLCVLYISSINIANFEAVIAAVDDLKSQFMEMTTRGKKPSDFGLMVKCSPNSLETNLLVTSRSKMRHSQRVEYWISYGGTVADTSKLYKDPERNKKNEKLCKEFIAELATSSQKFQTIGSRQVIKNVSKINIGTFISKLDIHFENRKFDVDTLARYIVDSKLFPLWDIVVATGTEESLKWEIGGSTFVAARRKCEIRQEENFIRVGLGNNRLVEPGIFSSGLTENELAHIRENLDRTPTYTDYLNVTDRNPLLIFYPLSLYAGDEPINDRPYIGFAVGFPARGQSETASYQANERKLAEMLNAMDALDPEEEEGEE